MLILNPRAVRITRIFHVCVYIYIYAYTMQLQGSQYNYMYSPMTTSNDSYTFIVNAVLLSLILMWPTWHPAVFSMPFLPHSETSKIGGLTHKGLVSGARVRDAAALALLFFVGGGCWTVVIGLKDTSLYPARDAPCNVEYW